MHASQDRSLLVRTIARALPEDAEQLAVTQQEIGEIGKALGLELIEADFARENWANLRGTLLERADGSALNADQRAAIDLERAHALGLQAAKNLFRRLMQADGVKIKTIVGDEYLGAEALAVTFKISQKTARSWMKEQLALQGNAEAKARVIKHPITGSFFVRLEDVLDMAVRFERLI